MWEISSLNQYICFWYSVIMGVGIAIIYDLFKFDRLLFNRSNIFIFISDIVFWIMAAFSLFSFCIVFSNGQIRGYVLLGSFLGFLIYRVTLSQLFFLLLKPLKKYIKLLSNHYRKILERVASYISNLVFSAVKSAKKVTFIKKRKNNQIIEKNSWNCGRYCV